KMEYRLKRGDQEFGPYSLSDLQNYLQTGHVAATDLAFSEGMTDWVPVSQVLGDIPFPPAMQANPELMAAETVKLPPNLHWALLLLFNLFTRYFFNIVWAIIQANWARKLVGKNNALVLATMYPAGMVAGGIAVGVGSASHNPMLNLIGAL